MGTAVYAEYALEEITLKSSRKQRAPTTGGAEHTSAWWTRSRSLRSGKGRPSSAQGGGFEWCEWWIERGRSRRGTTTSSSKAQGRLQGVKGRRGGEHEGAGKPSDRGSNGYAGQRAGATDEAPAGAETRLARVQSKSFTSTRFYISYMVSLVDTPVA
ncbi:uncharacterized protein PITG_21782 [Phytophthora infestans T30-4]|uniref:Uncharacterized protein n=1 Tax=Phytophthora infestans (strain T30-4) TaxID=403677 RepID=D0RLQ5_PHYIT|nr:uncharacterized protein PITG_21782 [Phytophthora infestans T30-4]EEY64842.1 conserved hypothetical protein [Phytophthora infestans T30-4]|eukprot:XP_002910001.1 conserved hypothetical protein [Phytophthora infestans T30-4]